jgi:hypothetical protein
MIKAPKNKIQITNNLQATNFNHEITSKKNIGIWELRFICDLSFEIWNL